MRHHPALKYFLPDITDVGSQVFGAFIFMASSMVSLQQCLEYYSVCFSKCNNTRGKNECILRK